jgi:hypothetical protein
MEYISFNLNHELLVKLSPEGLAHWKRYDDERLALIKIHFPDYTGQPKPIEDYVLKQDVRGFIAIQGWQFVAIFGAVAGFGTKYFSAGVQMRAEDTELVLT